MTFTSLVSSCLGHVNGMNSKGSEVGRSGVCGGGSGGGGE